MFILTAEEAEKYIEPPRLAQVVVTPSQIQCQPKEAKAELRRGRSEISSAMSNLREIQWSAIGGTIGQMECLSLGRRRVTFSLRQGPGPMGTAKVTVVRE